VLQFKLEMCLLIGAITGSPRVSYVRVDLEKNLIEVLASSLGGSRRYDIGYDVPMLTSQRPTLLLPNFKKYPEFLDHPVAQLIPNLRSVAAYLIEETAASKLMMVVWNPAPTFFEDDQSMAIVERMLDICRRLTNFSSENNSEAVGEAENALMRVGMQEETIPFNGEPVSKFLFDTLIPKQRLLARNGTAYLALRQWRKPIKPYQVKALEAIKLDEMPACVDRVADEIVAAVTKVYGSLFNSVVPVPGGSSGRKRSFSVLIAEAVAARLKVAFNDVLIGSPVAVGSSHPKKSAALQPFGLSGDPGTYVLIVDDVATSGKHIELATQAVKTKANYCTAVAWIAD
jgi:hypothetical protein